MRTIPAIAAFLLLASVATAQPSVPNYQPPVPFAPLVPQPAPVRTIHDARAEAVKSNRIIIVFAGVPQQNLAGAVLFAGGAELDAKGRSGILFNVPGDANWYRLPPGADVVAEVNAVRERVVRPKAAIPFLKGKRRTADGDVPAVGLWPTTLPKPEGLVRYTPARYTQAIAITNGVDSIDRVPRTSLLRKWQVPGGLEGVDGWRSDLYKRPAGGVQWVGDISVLNSLGYFQANRGHKRAYNAGTLFADVLSHEGVVFEVRYAEKLASGRWDHFVAYRDRHARPFGYVPVKSSACVTCHAESGSGAYSSGLIPGGDFVISDPFYELE